VSKVVFAKAVRRHVDCPDEHVPGGTLGAVLDGYFTRHPAVRSYIVDEHGAVRKHIAVFVNGQLIADRSRLDLPVGDGDEVHVFQALSGG
jgi:sulfur carrier protein ThiS